MTENKTTEKLYKRFDDLDGDDGEFEFDIETLTQMKIWLVDFWYENHDDLTDEELEELKDRIMESDESEMFDRLSGIGYSFYELDEDGNAIIPKQLIIHITNITKEYFVESLEFINENNIFEMEMRIYREGKLSENFTVNIDAWEKEHEKYVNILSNELLDK